MSPPDQSAPPEGLFGARFADAKDAYVAKNSKRAADADEMKTGDRRLRQGSIDTRHSLMF